MAKLSIKVGATSVSVAVFIQDSASTTGAGKSGLAFNTSSLTCYAVVPGSSAAAITLATLAAANSAWSSGGFKEIDATNMVGWYRFDIPNTNISTGRSVGIHFQGASGMAPLPLEIELTGWDNQDAVHGGFSCLPNTAVTTNASLLTSGTGTDQVSVASGRIDAGKILGTAISTPATAGILDVNVKNMNNVAGTPITTIKAVQGLATDGVIPTATNLTNAPTSGDFTAVMKTSIGTAVAASAVASVTARVTANTDQLAGQTVTAAAGVTFPTSVASPTNITAGTMTTTTNLTTNNDKTGYALTNAGIDAILDRADAIEVGLTPRQALRLGAAADAGVLAGAATSSVTIKNAVANSKTRITATVDSDGNRSVVTTDVT